LRRSRTPGGRGLLDGSSSDLTSDITAGENSGSKPFFTMAATAALRRVCVLGELGIRED